MYVYIYVFKFHSSMITRCQEGKEGKFRVTVDKRGEKEFENDHFPRASFKLIQHKHSNKNYVFI